jgi:hypothetical protein
VIWPAPASASTTTVAHIAGTSAIPSVQLRVRVDRPTATLTARIVDYGTATRIDPFASEGVRNLTTESCWGESTVDDERRCGWSLRFGLVSGTA